MGGLISPYIRHRSCPLQNLKKIVCSIDDYSQKKNYFRFAVKLSNTAFYAFHHLLKNNESSG